MNIACLILAAVALNAVPARDTAKEKPARMSATNNARLAPGPLRVSANRRFLEDAQGKPFFYLGDTAWELFHRLSREDTDLYLRTRAEQGFTVIQAVALAEHEYQRPNAEGALPLADNDPARPNDAYFQHVDWVVERANELGLYIGMLPTWGDKWNAKWGAGPEIFTPENARVYGEWLGRRYRDKAIIWILGGDRPIESERHLAITRAMAEGLRKGDGGRHLITFHPMGGCTSAQWLHNESWLDFNMRQTGHTRDSDCWSKIGEDYARTPVKPCMDAEPGYEDHPSAFDPKNGYLDDYDVRKFTYWDLFAGAFGHTYGCHDIWQFRAEGWQPISWSRTLWKEAVLFPGARQVQHARHLIESRPFFVRIPDQSLIVGDAGTGTDHRQATRAEDGSYAFVYTASGKPVTVDLNKLSGEKLRAWWFDPRDGRATPLGEFARSGQREFTPPTSGPGCDWVLVLDDASKGYRVPGQVVR